MTELKPCPFCGGKARYFMDTLVYGPPQHIAYCTKCGGRTHGLDSKEEAIESWNKRPNPWHTGTPTEEGWYLLHYPESKEQPYELAQWNGEHFVAVKPFHAIIVRIEASSVPYWQKIEEKLNGHTD